MKRPSIRSKNDFTAKEKIQYGLVSILVLGGSIYAGRKLVKTAKSNSEEKKTFEEGGSATYAKQLKMAFDNDGYWGTDVKALRIVLSNIKSKVQLKKVFDAYTNEYHRNMYKDMSDELETSEYNEMLEIIAAKPTKEGQAPTSNQYTAWAKRLKAAFDKTYGFISGTDETAIKTVFNEIPTQHAFILVGVAYQKEYGDNLITALRGELEIWEYGDYMKIITTKPKG